jgi:hypothetical protein
LKKKQKRPAEATRSDLGPTDSKDNHNNKTNRNMNNNNRMPNNSNNNNSPFKFNEKTNTPPKKPPVKLEDFVKKLSRDSPTKQQLSSNTAKNELDANISKKRKDMSDENHTSPKKVKGPIDLFLSPKTATNGNMSPISPPNFNIPKKSNNNSNNKNVTLDNNDSPKPDDIAKSAQQPPQKEWNPQFELDGEPLHTQRVARSGTRGFRAPETLLRV